MRSLESDYAAAWRDLKKRRLIFLVLVSILGLLAIVWVMSALAALDLTVVFVTLLVLWSFAVEFAGARASQFSCPRCQKSLFFARSLRGRWYGNPFARKCVHCGLTIGAVRPNEERPQAAR